MMCSDGKIILFLPYIRMLLSFGQFETSVLCFDEHSDLQKHESSAEL